MNCFMLICLIGWLVFSYLPFQLGSVLKIRRFSVRMSTGPRFRWFACSFTVEIVFTIFGNLFFMNYGQRLAQKLEKKNPNILEENKPGYKTTEKWFKTHWTMLLVTWLFGVFKVIFWYKKVSSFLNVCVTNYTENTQ